MRVVTIFLLPVVQNTLLSPCDSHAPPSFAGGGWGRPTG